MLSTEEKIELWKQYAKCRDQSIRDRLIIEYSYLIKYVAGRLSIYFGSNVEYDDLIGFGVFGLIDAIDKFDINKGVKFETYASLRIRGAILDSIREMDWAPRSIRQKGKELESAFTMIEIETGRPATDIEVAKRMGVSLKEYYKILNSVNSSNPISLEEYLEQCNESGVKSDSIDWETQPDSYIEIVEMRDILSEAIDNLPEKEKVVISLYYFEELTLKEISEVMKVSESRISQLHTKALFRLKGKINRHRTLLNG
ncbi:MAG TPA: FliA/WhiG family RNA polymerase sigma factor [Clostridiaceae bacterium]|nr:FliA/WhiG family RNA polymerase sigma factor [Clostridiaceae bacterium]